METTASDDTENGEKQMNGATKRCLNCHISNDESSSGFKKCRTCLVQKKTDKIATENEKIQNMKTPNASKQFDKLKYRAKVLNYHCGWDIVILASHKHSRGRSIIRFGTSGVGEEFIGSNEDQSNSPTGKAVLNVFSSFVREKSKKPILGQDESTATTSSMSPRTSISSPVTSIASAISIHPVSTTCSSVTSSPLLTSSVTSSPSLTSSATSLPFSFSCSLTSPPSFLSSPLTFPPAHLSSSVTPSRPSISSSVTSPFPLPSSLTPLPFSLSSSVTSSLPSISSSVTSPPFSISSTVISRPSSLSPSSLSSPVIHPPLSHNLPSSPTTVPTTTDSASSSTTIKLPSDAVFVVDNGKCVGVGKSLTLTSVHGQTIPDNHSCILLTWAQDNYLAPFPCGNKEVKENLYFSKNCFYAVPHTMLRRLIVKNNQYSLSPIS